MVSALASLKVCIVDSDGDMRQMIRDALTGLRVTQIRECADSKMAQQLLSEFEPDLCLFDWSTGPVDAISFIKWIRANGEGRKSEMQLILMMERASTRNVIDARNAGVDEFLVKPISLRALHSRLLTILENPRVFVRSATYAGPDRRQHDRPFAGPDRRRSNAVEATEDGAGSPAAPKTTEAANS